MIFTDKQKQTLDNLSKSSDGKQLIEILEGLAKELDEVGKGYIEKPSAEFSELVKSGYLAGAKLRLLARIIETFDKIKGVVKLKL